MSQRPLFAIALSVAIGAAGLFPGQLCILGASGQQGTQANAPGTVSRRIGAIKAINGTVITLTPDFGPDVRITVSPAARILRTAPWEKDLKNATPIQLQDLQVGDRILVGGKIADDGASLDASTVVAMKRGDLDARHQQEMQDWQKRGAGGLVSAVDPAAGTVTISQVSFSGKKDLVIHSSSATVIRRYAPGSVRFDDAKPSALAEIHKDDQVLARGERNADGTELKADEIVSGAFRNIKGTVNSVDASSSTLSVQDLLSKKTVLIKVTADSQLRNLPPEMAQRIAVRLKAAAAGSAGGSSAAPSGSGNGTPAADATHPAPAGPGDSGAGMRGSGMGGGRAPDFQQILSRLPTAALADLHKGDAVMLVATEGTAGNITAITLVSGVEPILQAAPNATQAMMLAPWSLGAPVGDAGGP